MTLRRGRWGRLADLGALAAGVTGEAAGAAGSLLRAGTEAASRRFHTRTAARIAATLGEMKGLPQKAGQILSMLDAVIPEAHREIYGEVLETLQVRASPLPWEDLRPVLAEGLGRDPHELFAHLDPEPIAAASIGQVHRATRHDGRSVAVKVQYPGVREALAADLDNVGVLVRSLAAMVPGTDVQLLLDDVTSTFLEELDYAHEADVQAACAARWSGDDRLVVPAVHRDACGPTVLTTDWLPGVSPTEARHASASLRNAWGGALWQFTWTSITEHAWIHGDPHPGNLRFLADGRLGILDFGASADLPEPLHTGLDRAARAARAGADDAALLGHVLPAMGLPRDLSPTMAEPWACFSRLLFAPMAAEGSFKFTTPYVRALLEQVQAAKTAAASSALWRGVPTPTSRGTVTLMRTAMGQAAVLAQLEATLELRPTRSGAPTGTVPAMDSADGG